MSRHQQTLSSEKIREIAERAIRFRAMFETMENFLDSATKGDVFTLNYDDVETLVDAIYALMSSARGNPRVQEMINSERVQ